jgi:hypothetical protein
MKTLTILEYLSLLLILSGAIYTAYRSGEKTGSMYMLEYLRKNKYKNTQGRYVPFLSDTGFNRFISHMKKEKEIKDNG